MIIAVYTFTIDIDPEFGGLQQGWLPMLQGLREIFFRFKPWEHFSENEGIDLNNLPSGETYLSRLEKGFELQQTNQDIYQLAINTLARFIEQVLTRDARESFRYLLFWPLRLCPEMISLMSDRDPCALAILAGYFKALTFFEASALVQSTGNKHLSLVHAIIPSKWQPVVVNLP